MTSTEMIFKCEAETIFKFSLQENLFHDNVPPTNTDPSDCMPKQYHSTNINALQQ